jgi:hypothetical protein
MSPSIIASMVSYEGSSPGARRHDATMGMPTVIYRSTEGMRAHGGYAAALNEASSNLPG